MDIYLEKAKEQMSFYVAWCQCVCPQRSETRSSENVTVFSAKQHLNFLSFYFNQINKQHILGIMQEYFLQVQRREKSVLQQRKQMSKGHCRGCFPRSRSWRALLIVPTHVERNGHQELCSAIHCSGDLVENGPHVLHPCFVFELFLHISNSTLFITVLGSKIRVQRPMTLMRTAFQKRPLLQQRKTSW